MCSLAGPGRGGLPRGPWRALTRAAQQPLGRPPRLIQRSDGETQAGDRKYRVYDVVMRKPVRRRTSLPPELESAAIHHLRRSTRESRLAAAQLLARGWAIDEEARLSAVPERDRPDGYDEATDPAHPALAVIEGGRGD